MLSSLALFGLSNIYNEIILHASFYFFKWSEEKSEIATFENDVCLQSTTAL